MVGSDFHAKQLCFNVFSEGSVPNIQCHTRIFEISDRYIKQISRNCYHLSDFYRHNRLEFDSSPSDLMVNGESSPTHTIITFEAGTFVAVYAFNNLTNVAVPITQLE